MKATRREAVTGVRDRARTGASEKVASGFVDEAVATVSDKARALTDPESPPGRLGRWKSMLERLRRDRSRSEKLAGKMTSRLRIQALRAKGKIPAHKARDLGDLSRRMTSESRRMSVEAGKGPVVSLSKLWKKHTRRGGRLGDVTKSFESSRTFAAPSLTGQARSGLRNVGPRSSGRTQPKRKR